MRPLPAAFLSLVMSWPTFGQTYTIHTVAGTLGLPFPRDIAVDAAGNLFVPYLQGVEEISNGVTTTVAGGGYYLVLGDNGPATSAYLYNPEGVALGSAGNLYIADPDHNRIRRVSSGVITTVAGNGTPGFSGDNGPATNAQLWAAGRVAVDSAGNLYIADTNNNRIRKVSNGVITTVVGNGTQGFSGDNGPAISAQLYAPLGVALDSGGSLYIGDFGNNRIRKASNGVITTVVGNGAQGFSGDNGPATSASLITPTGVAVDSAGNLYIADFGNNRIRKVSNGVITTVAGNGTPGNSGDNGPATSAQLYMPYGVAVDSAGNVYIADSGNDRICVLTPSGTSGTLTPSPSSLAFTATVSGSTPAAQALSVSAPAATSYTASVSSTGNWLGISPSGSLNTTSNPTIAVSVNQSSLSAATYCGYIYLTASGGTQQSVQVTLVVSNSSSTKATGNVTVTANNQPGTPSLTFYQVGGTAPASQTLQVVSALPVSFTISSSATWLSVGVANGTSLYTPVNNPGFTISIVNPSSVAAGSYNATITIAPNGGTVVTVPVSLTVQAVPMVSATPTTLSFSYTAGGSNLLTQTVNVSGGGWALGFTATVTSGSSWLSVSPTSGTTPTTGTATLTVTAIPGTLGAGSYNGTILVSGIGTATGWTSITVNLTVAAPLTTAYTITTVVGNGTPGFGGDNGPATSAQLHYPYGVALDSAGNLYIADSDNSRIRKVSNGVITTVAGNGTHGFSGDNGPATSAELSGPTGVAVDSVGSLYIADMHNYRIRKVSNGVITTVAGGGSSLGDNGPATSASLLTPIGVAVDSAGNLYIADVNAYRIREVSNGVITTVAGNGWEGFSGDNGPATNAQLANPSGVAVDSAGNLYIADSSNRRIRKVSNGVITTVAGNGYEGFTGDNGPATSAELDLPQGIAVDSAGSLYIADLNRIRKVSSGVITTVAGNGVCCGFTGDGGPAASAQFAYPQGVAVNSAGNVYIADTSNNRIRFLTPLSCTYSVSPTSLQAPAAGANLTVGIQTTASCPWTVSGLPSWITVSGASSGAGSATVTLVVAPNNSGAPLSATVLIAGMSVTVTQAVPAVTASPTRLSFAYQAGGNTPSPASITVTGSTNGLSFLATATALSGGNWLSVSPASGVTPGSVTVNVNPAGLTANTYTGAVVVVGAGGASGSTTINVTLTVTAPLLTISAVVNAASYVRGAVSPGELVTLFGTAIGPATAVGAALDPSNPTKLATTIGGVQVLFNGVAAPMIYASSGQVSAVVPYEMAPVVNPSVWIKYVGQTSNAISLTSATTAPGLFTQNASGSGPGAILNQDNSLNGPGNRAAKGSIVQVYLTGEGQTSPPSITGSITTATLPPPQVTPAPLLAVGVTISGQPASYVYAGEAPGLVAGMMQLNLQIPANAPSGDLQILVSVGGNTSQSGVTVSVQ